jgi:hypothetical protein
MTLTLQQLSDNEIQIFNEAGYQQRHTGVRIVDTSSDWLLKDYRSIHQQYLFLFKNSTDEVVKLEALKRLIFLNWYFVVEPEYYTGIKNLDETSIFSSYSILNEYIKEDKLDDELKWMLSFYGSWDYIIFQHSQHQLSELTAFVESVDNSVRHYPKKEIISQTMDNRGQLGEYWRSLNK